MVRTLSGKFKSGEVLVDEADVGLVPSIGEVASFLFVILV